MATEKFDFESNKKVCELKVGNKVITKDWKRGNGHKRQSEEEEDYEELLSMSIGASKSRDVIVKFMVDKEGSKAESVQSRNLFKVGLNRNGHGRK